MLQANRSLESLATDLLHAGVLQPTPKDNLCDLVCAVPAVAGVVAAPPPRAGTPSSKGDAKGPPQRGTQPRKSERKASDVREPVVPSPEALQQQVALQRAAGVAVPTLGSIKQELLLKLVLPWMSSVVHAQYDAISLHLHHACFKIDSGHNIKSSEH